MSNRRLIVGIAMLVVLCLFASTAVWGEKCKKVNSRHLEPGTILYGPENCDGYDGCVTSKISGTFNGTLTERFNFADSYHLIDDAWAFTNYGVIETKQGELFFRERSMADFEAPDGFVVHINVTGGTGRYEGATGWMAYFDNFAGNSTTWGGEVCWGDKD